MGLVAGLIGGQVGLFLAALVLFIKGKGKVSSTKTIGGLQYRLGALICMLPLPLTVLIAQLTGSKENNLLFNSIALLTGTTGIALLAAGLVIGMVVIYTSPTVDPATR